MIHKKNKHNIILSKRMDDSKDIPTNLFLYDAYL